MAIARLNNTKRFCFIGNHPDAELYFLKAVVAGRNTVVFKCVNAKNLSLCRAIPTNAEV